jgi:hypothetical protein
LTGSGAGCSSRPVPFQLATIIMASAVQRA